jgi:hypothetical protein
VHIGLCIVVCCVLCVVPVAMCYILAIRIAIMSTGMCIGYTIYCIAVPLPLPLPFLPLQRSPPSRLRLRRQLLLRADQLRDQRSRRPGARSGNFTPPGTIWAVQPGGSWSGLGTTKATDSRTHATQSGGLLDSDALTGQYSQTRVQRRERRRPPK